MKLIYRKYLTTMALIWTGCFVLLLFVYILVLTPQKKTKKQIQKQFDEKKQMYDSTQKAAQEETQIQLNEQIERLRNELKNFAIDFEDSANLTFDISQIANEKRVNSFSVRTKDNRRGQILRDCNYISENYIDVSFTAGFNQFATFLNALERHRPVVFVDKFTITRSRQDDSGHQVSMKLAIFVRKQQDS